MKDVAERSFELITQTDLDRLATLAKADLEARLDRRPRWAVYRDRVITVALCQGAAMHYLDRRSGVKDIDIWTFFAGHPDGPFPHRWLTHADFGPSHFGRRDSEPGTCGYEGRRVDFNARSLPEPPDVDPIEALVRYLDAGRTESARHLAAKAAVILQPSPLRGVVAWPATGIDRATPS